MIVKKIIYTLDMIRIIRKLNAVPFSRLNCFKSSSHLLKVIRLKERGILKYSVFLRLVGVKHGNMFTAYCPHKESVTPGQYCKA